MNKGPEQIRKTSKEGRHCKGQTELATVGAESPERAVRSRQVLTRSGPISQRRPFPVSQQGMGLQSPQATVERGDLQRSKLAGLLPKQPGLKNETA